MSDPFLQCYLDANGKRDDYPFPGGDKPIVDVPTKPAECKCEDETQSLADLMSNPPLVECTSGPVRRLRTVPADHFPDAGNMVPNCLHEADRLTSQDRNQSYGHPLDDYECTAALWTALLRHKGLLKDGAEIDAETAIACMVQVKLSRQMHVHKPDNLIDACGYLRCWEMTIQERERRAREQGAVVPSANE